MVEPGHSKDSGETDIFNYAIAYDRDNREPLFYEAYPGSIVDVSQLRHTLDKARGYGYKSIGFILDRGYFCRENIRFMDDCGYDFVIMAKGMKALVLEVRGTFENDRRKSIRAYRVSGTTVKRRLYAGDKKERYFHIFYDDGKKAAERERFEEKIDRMGRKQTAKRRQLDDKKVLEAYHAGDNERLQHLRDVHEDLCCGGTFLKEQAVSPV